MKIAVATRRFTTIASHAGKTRDWLLFDARPGEELPEPRRITLNREQVLHDFDDQAAHPLDETDVLLASGAGDGFVRHMKKRGTQVRLTGETDPATAARKVLNGQQLAEKGFDPVLLLCKVRDLFSRH